MNSTSSLNISSTTFNTTESEVGIFFSFYITPVLFPLAIPEGFNRSTYNDTIDSSVIGATVAGMELMDLPEPVVITIISTRIQNHLVS